MRLQQASKAVLEKLKMLNNLDLMWSPSYARTTANFFDAASSPGMIKLLIVEAVHKVLLHRLTGVANRLNQKLSLHVKKGLTCLGLFDTNV